MLFVSFQDMTNVKHFIKNLPKAELHVHIEGTLEPELMFAIAKRNSITLPYPSVEVLKGAYDFHNLQEFLDIYYEGAKVLIYEKDFYDITWAYLTKVHNQAVRHVEIFFDPQTHTERGVSFGTVVNGIHRALQNAQEKLGISSRLIMCFLRHLDEEAALITFEQALSHKEKISAVGLDSSEKGHPPSKFTRVYERALSKGFLTVAHAGEEGPAEYVREALELLHISRIDHGNHILDDEALTAEAAQKQIPLTVCPLSNLKLKVIDNMINHPLKKMMGKGLLTTINSDDPAYFGGYVNANYEAVAEALNLTTGELAQLAKNSFIASFLSVSEKQTHIQEVEEYAQNHIS